MNVAAAKAAVFAITSCMGVASLWHFATRGNGWWTAAATVVVLTNALAVVANVLAGEDA